MKNITEWSESRKEKSDRVDACLNHLMRKNAYRSLKTGIVPKKMTLEDIADFCGVDRMVIYRTEQQALEKLRSKFTNFDL